MTVLAVLIISDVLAITLQLLLISLCENDDPEDDRLSEIYRVIILICSLIEMLIDLVMGIKFACLFGFFVEKIKASRIHESGTSFSCFNKYMIAFTIFLIVLNILRSFTPFLFNSYVSEMID